MCSNKPNLIVDKFIKCVEILIMYFRYTTINRQRSSTTSTTEEPLESEESDNEADEPVQQFSRSRAVESDLTVATTPKPLQYVNIRRARPTTSSTSDTADDTASR